MATNKKPLTLERAETLCKNIHLWENVKQMVGVGIEKFSKELDYEGMLRQRLSRGGDVKTSLILVLSERLGVNYFDMFIQYLPPHLRETAQTREKDEIIQQKDAEILHLQSQLIQHKERIASLESMVDKALSRG